MALWKRKPDEVVKIHVDMDTIESLILQIDSATERLQELIDKSAVTIQSLNRAKGEADVATRNAKQAAEDARQAARKTSAGRKW